MVNVIVVLPDGRKGQIQVLPDALVEDVKKTIVSDLKLGAPERYILSIAAAPETEGRIIGQMGLIDGDYLFLFNIQTAKGLPAKVNPDDFK